jgi:hypothetical protein
VAAQLVERPSTRFLLGAAAPDLARMGQVPVAGSGPPDLVAGVAAHHRTDAAFHGSTWFRERNRALVAELDRRGVRRGPARGAGHVVVELLLDGALLEDPDHAGTFGPAWAALGEPTQDALAMVPADHRHRWSDLLRRLTDRLEPVRYGEATYAADRTAGTLGFRPRLAMTEDEEAALREVAVDAQDDIRATAPDVVRSVVGALARS